MCHIFYQRPEHVTCPVNFQVMSWTLAAVYWKVENWTIGTAMLDVFNDCVPVILFCKSKATEWKQNLLNLIELLHKEMTIWEFVLSY